MIIYEKAVFCEHVADIRPSLHQKAAGSGRVWFGSVSPTAARSV